MSDIKVNKELQIKYDDHYSDKSEKWRELGAIEKVRNIMKVGESLQPKSLIEVGAGDGNLIALLDKKGFCDNITAVEISDSAIRQIQKKDIPSLKQVIKFDGYTLPFSDGEFDLVICSHVIEHVEHPRVLLREIKRISSYQIFEIPIDFSFKVDKRTEHFLSYGHINIFTPQTFNFLLLSEGFHILKKRNTMYNKKSLTYQFGVLSLKYIVLRTKTILWNIIPILKRLKPSAYTVLTQ